MNEEMTNQDAVQSTEVVEQNQDTEMAQKPKEEVKTFTRDELNKIVAAEKAKALEGYRLQVQAERDEAEKLSRMKAEEKLAYEKQQAEEKANSALAELNAYKLKDEAVKIAQQKQLPLSFLDDLDFKSLKAEQVDDVISSRAKAFQAAVESALNERLKQSPPETHTGGTSVQSVTKEQFERMTAFEVAQLRVDNPELYNKLMKKETR